MDDSRIIHGDCLVELPKLEASSADAVICDPPYAIGFMGKAFDKFSGCMQHDNGKRDFQEWCVQWATEVLRVLKPGGYLAAFGGSRTYHRLTCAIEDAGFEIRDCVMYMYATGFPKGKACLKPSYEPVVISRRPG